MNELVSPTLPSKHLNACIYFNKLLMDMKLTLMKKEPVEPITNERLREGIKYINDLENCKLEIVKKY